MEIKNLKKVAERILKAISQKEKIFLYGDADPDGIGAVIILEETIKQLGGEVVFSYILDREKEGYGITKEGLFFLKKMLEEKEKALLIALDLGITSFEEVELAKKLGFEVIIIEHHEVLEKTPKASLIVDPKQKGDKYPFKQLATAGIAYKLAKLLFSLVEENYSPEKLLELVAIATIADQMPLEDENEKLVKEGLLALNYTKREGLKALMELTNFKSSADIEEVKRKIISFLNSGQTKNHQNETYLLLTEEKKEKILKLTKTLTKRTEKKKERLKEIFKEIEKKFDENSTIFFEGETNWPLFLAGTIASKICQKYKIPSFIFKKGKKESRGSVRVPSGLNGVEAMKHCQKLLEDFGGHPPAAGFRIKNENLENFKKCLIEYFNHEKVNCLH